MSTTIAVDYRMSRSSGIGVNVRNTVRHLLQSHADEFQLVLLGGDAETSFEKVGRHPFRAPIYSVTEQIEAPFRAPRGTDVFWSPHYNAPWVSPGRLVVTVNDVYHLDLPPGASRGLKSLYARMMFANIRRRAGGIICISRYTADELIRATGIDAKRVTVIYPGPGTEWKSGVKPKRPIERPYALYVGNVKPHKNLVRLLAAFDQLRDKVPHSLAIVGKREGFITPDRQVMSAAERLGDRVTFTGELSDEALRGYYASADLLVHPSLYEGFGFPPLEAMAHDVPVALSTATSLPEVCGDAAAYFDPLSVDEMAKVVRQALTDEALRADLRAKGRERVRRYSWSEAAGETARLFRQVAAR